MLIKPKIHDKLFTIRIELNNGIVREHPISKEMDFVEDPHTCKRAFVHHYTKNEAIDEIVNHLLTLKDTLIIK